MENSSYSAPAFLPTLPKFGVALKTVEASYQSGRLREREVEGLFEDAVTRFTKSELRWLCRVPPLGLCLHSLPWPFPKEQR